MVPSWRPSLAESAAPGWLFAAHDEQRRDSRAEGEGETQIVKIRERHVTEQPGHLAQFASLFEEYFDLAVVSRDPAEKPARKIEKDA